MVEHDPERVTGLFTTDAEKMRRLVALARELGDVAITHLNTFDPDSPLSAKEQLRQHELDQPAIHLLHHINPNDRGHASRQADKMKRHGIWTIRDMLAVGSNWLGLSDLMKTRLIHAVGSMFPEEELEGDPTPADVATFCHDLHQVTAAVIFFNLDTRQPEFSDEFGNFTPYQQRFTLADLLDETNPDPRRLIENFDRVRDEAMRFAAEFIEARQRMH